MMGAMIAVGVVALVTGIVLGGWWGRRENPISAPELDATGAPRLRVTTGDGAILHADVPATPLVIGRDPDAASVVVADRAGRVSREHCEVRWDEDSALFVVTDLGSSNGTVIEGRVVCVPGESMRVAAGAVLLLGGPDVLVALSRTSSP
jgi:hypothetical protein